MTSHDIQEKVQQVGAENLIVLKEDLVSTAIKRDIGLANALVKLKVPQTFLMMRVLMILKLLNPDETLFRKPNLLKQIQA